MLFRSSIAYSPHSRWEIPFKGSRNLMQGIMRLPKNHMHTHSTNRASGLAAICPAVSNSSSNIRRIGLASALKLGTSTKPYSSNINLSPDLLLGPPLTLVELNVTATSPCLELDVNRHELTWLHVNPLRPFEWRASADQNAPQFTSVMTVTTWYTVSPTLSMRPS